MKGERPIDVVNNVRLSNRSGEQVSLEGTSAYNASSLFSDTADLPQAGRIYIGAAGTLTIILKNDSIPLAWTVDQPTLLPIVVKRILSTGSDAITAYIVN